MATYLRGDGVLFIYLRGDGNLSTYVGGGAYLSIFIFISIYLNLSFYLSRRRWPPIYGGGMAAYLGGNGNLLLHRWVEIFMSSYRKLDLTWCPLGPNINICCRRLDLALSMAHVVWGSHNSEILKRKLDLVWSPHRPNISIRYR